VEVLAVQYPGRQDRLREPCVPSLPELADRLLPLLLDGWTDRPLALFGHSMGASLAFELAGLLEQAGVVPALLFVSGRPAPSRFRGDADVHGQGDDALLAEIRRLAGTDARILGDDEVLRLALPAIRNDFRAAETYRPERVLTVGCPVTALVGDDDPRAPLDDVRAWKEHTTGEFAMEVYPGGHFYLTDRAPEVVRRISDGLTALVPSAVDR
jgi:surfactin synthase thioesterase subunit